MKQYGDAVVSEHVTLKEEDGGAVVWKAEGFKQMLWLHSPAAHSSLVPEVLVSYPHSMLWGHWFCWCCRLQGMGLSEAPICSNPDSGNSSLGDLSHNSLVLSSVVWLWGLLKVSLSIFCTLP